MSQYIRSKVTIHKGAETFQGRKLFKGRNYGTQGLTIPKKNSFRGNYTRKYSKYFVKTSGEYLIPAFAKVNYQDRDLLLRKNH